MGLIYSSSDSAQLISALKQNLQSGKEASEQLKAGSQKVIAAVDGKTLSGAAYTAGKGLFSDLVLPTISKVTSAMDRMEQELQTYTNADQRISSEGTLDEDKLKQQIATKKAMKASVDASAAVVRALSRNSPVAKVLDALLSVQNNLNRMSNTFEDDIRELQKKLEKLHQFSSQTNELFANSLNDMKLAMQGVTVLNNTIVNSDGTYQLPKGTDKSWFNQLKDEDKQPDVGDREYKLIDLGYGKLWMWVKKGQTSATSEDIAVTLAYNEWLSRMIDKYGLGFIQGDRPKGIDDLFYEQNATLIKELTTGIDSVTGKKLTKAEMLGRASLLANGMITIGVMVKGVVNVGKTKNVKPGNTNKKASGADDIFKRTPEIEKHLKYTDPSVPRKRGIGGAHNSEEFFKNDVKVIKQTSTDVPGVSVVEYQIPELDAKGLPTGNYKKTIFKKSIYDPSIIPDDEYIKRGLEAANDAIKNNNGNMPREWVGKDSSGKTWRGFFKDGKIDTFFPD